MRHFTAPKHVIDFLKNENGADRKNKVLSRVHDALKQIADLVPLAPMRLSSIVVQNIPKRYNVTEHVSSVCIFSERVDANSRCISYYSILMNLLSFFSCYDMSNSMLEHILCLTMLISSI